MAIPASRSRRFFSLRWKIIIPLSLVLLAVNASLSYINYNGQRAQFELAHKASEAQSRRFAAEVITQLGTQLEMSANLIPNLSDVHGAVVNGDKTALQLYYQRYWDALHFNSGLEQVLFFKPDGQLFASWKENSTQVDEAALSAQVRQVIADEHPQRLLACTTSCLYYFIIPVLDNGYSVAAVAVAASFVDAVLSFQRIASSDMALAVLAPNISGLPASSRQPQVPALNRRVLAASGGLQSIEILQSIQPRDIRVNQRISVSYRDRQYEILPVPIIIGASIGNPSMAVIFDRTQDLKHLHAVAWQSAGIGMVGLIISELMLLVLLWIPMRHLKRTAEALPLLGRGEFEVVRSRLEKTRRRNLLHDELDTLNASALDLADRLEALQEKNHSHSTELDNLVRQLSRERDFVSGLLDTAQMIIVTQDSQGRILMANAYMLALTGFDYRELRGAKLTDYFSQPKQAMDANRELSALLHSDGASLRQETALRCKNGESRDVVWIHSSLGAENPDDAAILSVGLDITELHRVEKQASYLTEYDPLTGLYNRHRFQEMLQEILSHTETQFNGALIYLDLDEFKSLNDTAGHTAADQVLHAVASQLQGLLPTPALIGRLGGDDFGVFFNHLDAQHAIQLARHIQHSLSMITLAEVPLSHKVSACIGITLFPEHGTVAQELLANADLALFRAKESGRGNLHLYAPDEGLMERVLNRVYWVDKIEQALADDQFELYFQPILSLSDNQVSHYEALVRMHNPAGDLFMPIEFIGVAETTGLIRGIDRLVLHKAIAALAELQLKTPDIKLSVNLSGRSFSNPRWLELLQDELNSSGINPAGLIFEITETAAVEDMASARVLMEKVIALGCAFSLDDFGVGFASFDYLKQLPVEYVKIDGSFIRNLATSTDDQLFVKTLVQAAHGFGKKTVAEFVENAEIVQLLRDYGVDYAQGYHIGKPDPVFGLIA
ncbi:EAL domain-containing protein [Sulfuriferula sp. GW1]|uniref:bifunctional diguanylate cyclase/phosphodiesterase n=1 Tax=Sulfuriferula sp. GW1 TaxID=3345111 RepID=UPI0039AF5693